MFSKGGGEAMAADFKVDFLGRVPIDPTLTTLIEAEGGSFVNRFTQSQLYPIFQEISRKVVGKCGDSV